MRRLPAATLALSAVGATAWLASEGFTSHAVIPVHGDRPTVCSGMTHWENGTPVKMTDTCTRQQAIKMIGTVVDGKYCQAVRDSLGQTPVTQIEFDQACDFAGQYGTGAWRASSMRKLWQKGQYTEGCEAFLRYKYITATTPGSDPRWVHAGRGRWRFDCSIPGNTVCGGVWSRSVKRYESCAQQ